MEAFFLTCVVVAFFVTKGRTDTAAYTAGKEPPGLARARMRHDAGGGARTPSGRPVGRGAFGLLVASRWTEACRAAQHRAEHRAARRRAWYDATAPGRDERWRATQRRRLERADRARARWAQARGLTTGVGSSGRTDRAGRAVPEPWGRRRPGTGPAAVAGGAAVTATDDPGPPTSAGDTPVPGPAPDGVDNTGTDTDDTDPTTSPGPAAPILATTSTTTASGGHGMYETAVARLTAAAEACGLYQSQLSGFVDRLAGQGWGGQVTGPLTDSLTGLAAAEASYRDLAGQMRAQGDQGRDAYEAAPYVPGPHAVL
ncbi:hypothetical protein Ae717Ps2_5924c [Pseudonocardia sp. Ae717_Ps2]|uniref:hypothetical protein n=1 Tax=Pseudonocardia sp. Ae717_Ps2 TaxID=1885573 RepID=UPI00094B12E2|nr:hypothetical protein [Pseudonocardia sp. Ae717_Ps2]OLM28955.1 hypothetical protein Ae717Ps2_5879c [Pseudonocardia sp. Ae717_Ps2]OLM29000.1 hypothetical protein Ae717Ps2_5924c [Pseudonocardia sp. Ae717_Ps2]